MVEFALVIPILVIIFVGIADFGRIFNAGVIVEAATRDAAEHGSQSYLANPPGDPSTSASARMASAAPTPADPAFYNALHLDVARVVCAETKSLANNDSDGAANCPSWPRVAVCVHDNVDPTCGQVPAGFGSTIPSQCGELGGGWSNAAPASGERSVEVRACYKFTTLLRVPPLTVGDFYVQRTRSFTIPCYFATQFGPCS